MADDGFIWDDVVEVPIENDFAVTENEKHEEVEKPKVKKKKKKSKWKKRLLLVVIFLLLLSLCFAPILKVDTISISNTYFVTQEQIEKSIGISAGNSYSFWDLRQDTITDEISELVSDINLSYDYKTNTLNVQIEEIKPLASAEDGTFYYSVDGEILTTKSFYYSVPKMIGFDAEMQKQLVAALNKLDYKIIKEIVGIEYVPDDVLPDLVKMQMMDGNVVYITITEIPNKMPYYIQMNQIIDQKAVKKPGIIHLERGNYYEPM